MNIQHYLVAVFTAAVGLTAIAEDPKPTIATFGDYGNFKTQWFAQSDVTSNDWGTHHNAMILDIASNLGTKDIYFVDDGQLGVYLNRFELMDLTDYFADYKSNFYPYAVEKGIDTLGKQRAIPMGSGVGVQFYRTDLMIAAGVSIEQISGTWDQYLQAARTAKQNGYYIVDNSDAILRLYVHSHLENGAFLFEDENGAYNLDRDFYTQAYEFAKIFHDEALAFETGMWNDNWYGAYRGDKLLASVQGIWLSGHLSVWIAPDQINKFAMAQTPGTKSGNWGGTHLIVNKNADMSVIKPILDSLIGGSDKADYQAEFNEYGIVSTRIDMLENYNEVFYKNYLNQTNVNSVIKKSIQDLAIIRTHPLDQYAQTLYFTQYYQMVINDEISIDEAITQMNQLLADRLAELTIN
ncbi:ABC transporter substrate-binding protein [Marinicellulosiphila megalodicopiae]|uniref:ABC transporter substrate-binding protein n=1 Tax=Marinicellulosiphila megalodicopiae TaxID=2724896 RepID=UPI003BB20487